jgi:Ca-activated chloride channel family protein
MKEQLTTDNRQPTTVMKLIPHLNECQRALIAIISVMLMATGMLLYLLFAPLRSRAQSGVLIPASIKNEADAALLSLAEMSVDVLIDNQHATVVVEQIFENHTGSQLEGKYLFALPPQSSLSDFAIWENDQRLPGVIYEKRRANHVYAQLKNNVIDPGLLQQDDEHGGAAAFSAKVFPIPPHGTKRVELTYTERLAVENLGAHFRFPLKAAFGAPQRTGLLKLRVRLLNDLPVTPLTFASGQYALAAKQPSSLAANEIVYEGTATHVELKEDLAFSYGLNVPNSTLSFIAHRAPERITAYDLRDPALAKPNPDGYFEARALFNEQNQTRANAPRNVLLLLDTSLSMHGEKLARSVEALDYLLHRLTPSDQFNLLLFNDEAKAFENKPQAATTENIERALAFVRGSYLGGGTDLAQALRKGIELSAAFPAGERSLVLISDANATRRTIQTKPLVAAFTQANAQQTRLYALALGSDANDKLLAELTRATHGYFTQARETESIAPQLQLLFAHLGRQSIENLQLNGDAFTEVYATSDGYSFDGASSTFIGRYATPQANAALRVTGLFGAQPLTLTRTVNLPANETAHAHLPREWARARVNALLREMDLHGERDDLIAEIIRLSRKYRFVTPYTAFLAAPRALLRPRVIQPGDPVIRVKTDPAINAVTAVLPFGETLPLRFIQQAGVWQTRFLAPAWLPDGTYRCRLLLTDKDGNGYQEEKSFVIDSHAPRLKADIATSVRAGAELPLRVTADRDTTRLTAKLYGAAPVVLSWSSEAKANVGTVRVPAGLAAGSYRLTVTAEDAAHNQSQIEINVNVF